ncbi:MAG: ABC transporter ATP-binding protein/permease [Ezakiella sp.]|nr:ABC transporter ATP-binding protein/permease [Ezakiella sp.]MDD7471525.1 ABC transporter ATP-binding protein [Bacillota bacterium]
MKFKLNKFFACKSILAFLLGLYSIFMIFFRSYIIDSVKSEYFFIILFSFVGLVFLKRIILIFDKKISDYNYEFYKSDVERELISKFKKIAISDIEDSNVRDMYDAAINESGFNKDLIDNASKIIKSLIIFLGTIFVLFKFSVFYSVIALLFIIVMLFIEAYNFNKSGDIWKNYRANMRMANYYSNVLINNEFLSERKIFRTETFFNDKFIKSFKSAADKNKLIATRRFSRDFIFEILFVVLIISFIFKFVNLLKINMISIGLFMSLFYQLIEVKSSISEIVFSYFNYNNARLKKNNFDNFMNLENFADGNLPIDNINTIEFCDVYFSYPGAEKSVLNGVSFKLINKNYGLVGENGSGKSTLTKLLMGLYKPTFGKILVNGKDISQYKKTDIKKLISVVFQNSYHYPASLYDNLSFNGDMNLNDEVLESLNINEIINKLPNGTETNLSNISRDSVSLSGGEWQRVAIARALLKQSYLYILDEPNALLDPISESKMYNKYKNILRNKISLLISHRLGATSNLDEIIVLKDGKIYAIGTHEELMETDYYSKLYNSQKEMYL